ncbi:MAG: HAD family hydrolase [Myxococcota bacterium]
MTARPRLLALDLDGTLLRRDGTVDPRDVEAIRRARHAGIHVTLATGRLVHGTLDTARTLALEGSLVCGDGATIVDAVTAEIRHAEPVDTRTTVGILETLRAHGAVAFVLCHGEVHADEEGRRFDRWVRIWSERVHYHVRLEQAGEWQREGAVAMTLGLGSESVINAAHATMETRWSGHIHNTRFPFSDVHAVRTYRAGCSKGSALERVATELGVERAARVAVGDWYNDVSMFEWAGRSFAMGGAPESVRAAATDGLQAMAGTGGGVAEAIHKLLDV